MDNDEKYDNNNTKEKPNLFKINKQPQHDVPDDTKDDHKEPRYIPSTPGIKESTTEKIMFGKPIGDRRDKIDKPYENKKAIIKCIGRIISWFGEYNQDDGSRKLYVGTGTVYLVEHDTAFVITCAHNVVKKNKENKEKMLAKSIRFIREAPNGNAEQNKTNNKVQKLLKKAQDKAFPSKPCYQQYKIKRFKFMPGYAFTEMDETDLAYLSFTDFDGYYKKIFEQKQDVVHLGCSDDILEDEKDEIEYELYGYPCPGKNEKHSKVKSGEMWGMTSLSKSIHEKIEMYVKLNNDKDMFVYNAIDTEGGQSGSAIFRSLNDDEFEIVGVHTGGDKGEGMNWGVALNKNKLQWIKNHTVCQEIPLEIHSQRGQLSPNHPKHLSNSNCSYYKSEEGTFLDDWVIFSLKHENTKYYPKKIKIINKIWGGSAMKEFSLFIGDENKWTKIHNDRLKVKKGSLLDRHKGRLFSLLDNVETNKDNKLFKLIIHNHGKDHGYGNWIWFCEFIILGYFI